MGVEGRKSTVVGQPPTLQIQTQPRLERRQTAGYNRSQPSYQAAPPQRMRRKEEREGKDCRGERSFAPTASLSKVFKTPHTLTTSPPPDGFTLSGHPSVHLFLGEFQHHPPEAQTPGRHPSPLGFQQPFRDVIPPHKIEEPRTSSSPPSASTRLTIKPRCFSQEREWAGTSQKRCDGNGFQWLS